MGKGKERKRRDGKGGEEGTKLKFLIAGIKKE
jgi:hypothetical protein